MRNWHHRIVKLDKARAYITLFNESITDPNKKINILGNDDVHVGIIESGYLIEYKSLDNSSTTLNINQYKAAHYCFDDINGTRKVIFRKQNEENKKKFTEDILINNVKDFLENHTTSTAGIVAANANNDTKIEGICPNVRIINSQDFNDVLIQSLVNLYTFGNVKSTYYREFIKQNLPDNLIPEISQYNNNGGLLEDYSKKYVSIINMSASSKFKESDDVYNGKSKENFEIFHRAGTNFILSELIAYGRDGRGCLIVNSAGNSPSPINEDTKPFAKSKKALIVSASMIDSQKLINDINAGLNPDLGSYKFEETKAEYSSFGKRVDLCAPSSARANPTPNDLSISAPSMIMGGGISVKAIIYN